MAMNDTIEFNLGRLLHFIPLVVLALGVVANWVTMDQRSSANTAAIDRTIMLTAQAIEREHVLIIGLETRLRNTELQLATQESNLNAIKDLLREVRNDVKELVARQEP
jgi:hypothetical protein